MSRSPGMPSDGSYGDVSRRDCVCAGEGRVCPEEDRLAGRTKPNALTVTLEPSTVS